MQHEDDSSDSDESTASLSSTSSTSASAEFVACMTTDQRLALAAKEVFFIRCLYRSLVKESVAHMLYRHSKVRRRPRFCSRPTPLCKSSMTGANPCNSFQGLRRFCCRFVCYFERSCRCTVISMLHSNWLDRVRFMCRTSLLRMCYVFAMFVRSITVKTQCGCHDNAHWNSWIH